MNLRIVDLRFGSSLEDQSTFQKIFLHFTTQKSCTTNTLYWGYINITPCIGAFWRQFLVNSAETASQKRHFDFAKEGEERTLLILMLSFQDVTFVLCWQQITLLNVFSRFTIFTVFIKRIGPRWCQILICTFVDIFDLALQE